MLTIKIKLDFIIKKIFYLFFIYILSTNTFAFCAKEMLSETSPVRQEKSNIQNMMEAINILNEEEEQIVNKMKEIDFKYNIIENAVKSFYDFFIRLYAERFCQQEKKFEDPFNCQEAIDDANKLDEKLNQALQPLSNECRTQISQFRVLTLIQDMTEQLKKILSEYRILNKNRCDSVSYLKVPIEESIQQQPNFSDPSVYQPILHERHRAKLSLFADMQSYICSCRRQLSRTFADVLQRLLGNLDATLQILTDERLRELNEVLQETPRIFPASENPSQDV
jgi:hypothetical protein